MSQRLLAAARVRNAIIIQMNSTGMFKTNKPIGWCKLTLKVYMEIYRGERTPQSLMMRYCDIRVRHLVLDEGTANERHMWDCQMIRDVREVA